MFTKLFWRDTIERIISTMAQFLLVLGGVDGSGFLNLQFEQILTMTALGGLATLLKALAAANIGVTGSASFTVETAEPTVEKAPEGL